MHHYCSIIICISVQIQGSETFLQLLDTAKRICKVSNNNILTHKTDEQKTNYRKCNLHIQNQTHFKQTKNYCTLQTLTGIYIDIYKQNIETPIILQGIGKFLIELYALYTGNSFGKTFTMNITIVSCNYLFIFLSSTLSVCT